MGEQKPEKTKKHICAGLLAHVGNSWATAAGVYEARTGTFTPAPGVTPEEGYVDAVNRLVSAKYTYARLIIQYDYYRIVLGENE